MRSLVLCLAIFPVVSLAAEPLASRTLLDGKVTLLLPANLVAEPPDPDEPRVPGEVSVMLDDPSGELTVAVSHGSMELRPENVVHLEGATRMRYTYAKVNVSGVRKIGDRDFAVIDAEAPEHPSAPGERHRFLTAQTSHEGKLFLVTIACSGSHAASCGDLGKRVFDSIRLASPRAK